MFTIGLECVYIAQVYDYTLSLSQLQLTMFNGRKSTENSSISRRLLAHFASIQSSFQLFEAPFDDQLTDQSMCEKKIPKNINYKIKTVDSRQSNIVFFVWEKKIEANETHFLEYTQAILIKYQDWTICFEFNFPYITWTPILPIVMMVFSNAFYAFFSLKKIPFQHLRIKFYGYTKAERKSNASLRKTKRKLNELTVQIYGIEETKEKRSLFV